MDEEEQTQKFIEDWSQLKEKMTQMMVMLQVMQKEKNTNESPSASTEGQPAIPLLTHENSQQGVVMSFAGYPSNQNRPSFDPSNPPYGLPRGFVPPVAPGPTNGNPNSQNTTQTQIPTNSMVHSVNPNTSPFTFHIGANGIQVARGFASPQYVPVNQSCENPQSIERLEVLEERLRTIEGANSHGLRDASELCLVPNVVIPPKFKVPDFDKYIGTTCPKSHLTMYVRKMASHAQDDKLLIHFFQDSLTGAASNWYIHLERAHIRSFKDLADAFLKQYKYNIDMAPDRTQLQNMLKRDTETFKEYAQRWRELAAQVEPPLTEKEIIAMFIDTLRPPFYDRMIGSVSSNFSDMVIIGERIENGMRNGKIVESSVGVAGMTKAPFVKKNEEEAHVVASEQESEWFGHWIPGQISVNSQPSFQTTYTPYYPPHHQPNHPYVAAISQFPTQSYPMRTPYHPSNPFQHQTFPAIPPQQNLNANQRRQPYNPEKKPMQFDPIPMTYTELLHSLIEKSLLVPVPTRAVQPPYPKWFDPNVKCDYHGGVIGHSTENCKTLKYKVQDLINANVLSFQRDTLDAGGSGVHAVEDTLEHDL